MNLTVQTLDDQPAEAQLSGPINQAQMVVNHEPLGAALGPNAYARTVLLDMSGAEMIDSSGVNWLLIVHRRMRENGGRLVLHSLPPLVGNVFRVLRMNQVFEIATSHDEARRQVAGERV
jgi:anti-anti-sigma factor